MIWQSVDCSTFYRNAFATAKGENLSILNALVVFHLLIQTDPGYDSSEDTETLNILRESDVLMAQIAEFQRETLAISSKYLLMHDFFFGLFVALI